MEHKTWLWRRKQSTITVKECAEPTLARNGKKARAAELEKLLEDLNEQLSSARAEVNVKDGILKKQAKVAEEAIAGWEKAEAEAASFKQELDDALLQKATAEAKVFNSEVALNECRQQLSTVKESKQNVSDEATVKISREQEKSRKLEERLAEANKMLAAFDLENSNLNKDVAVKDKLIEELSQYKSQSEAEFEALVARLDVSEKENASLKYEVCMLTKELEIRNEERDFNLRSVEAAHRQHLDNTKKIAKLETECQKLRVMVRKRLPGPAALSKMRSEVEMLSSNSTETKKKRSPSIMEYGDTMSKKNGASIMERLSVVEQENKILKENLSRRNNELQSSHMMIVHTSSKLSQAEALLEELAKEQNLLERARCSPVPYDLPLASITEEIGNEDNKSTAESWASALISELEHFKSGKPATPSCHTGTSDISLMDDFLEMERLAIVSADNPLGGSAISPRQNSSSAVAKDSDARPGTSETTSMELVPLSNHPCPINLEKSISRIVDLVEGIIRRSMTSKYDQESEKDGISARESTMLSGYAAHAFLVKNSELIAILQHFVIICNDMVHRKANNLEVFVGELCSTLEWIVDHCFSLQDVSNMKEAIRKRVDVCQSQNDDEVQLRRNDHIAEVTEIEASEGFEFGKRRSMLANRNNSQSLLHNPESCSTHKVENRKIDKVNTDMDPTKKNVNERLKFTIVGNQSLINQHQESEKSTSDMHVEIERLKELNRIMEDKIDDENLMNNDLDAQLCAATAKLSEVSQKCSFLEVEMEEKSHHCEELEAACLELQLQLKSVASKGAYKYEKIPEGKQLSNEFEIAAASEKLAECQETILNLGKQLKALASPKDTTLFDKVIVRPKTERTYCMQTEGDPKSEELRSPKTKEIICSEPQQPPIASNNASNKTIGSIIQISSTTKNNPDTDAGRLAIVPKRPKGGISLFRRLLSRRKKGGNKMTIAVIT